MSIVEIAKLAGVSHTTVARVVNNKRNVRPETANRIREIMEQVGYIPKSPELRRGPRRSTSSGFKTGNIAFLSTSEHGSRVIGSSPIMNNVFHGIEEAVSSNGLSLIQGSIGSGLCLPPIIARGEIDGIIVWPDLKNVSAEILTVLSEYQIVYAMSGGEYSLPGDKVMPNNKEIGRIAAEQLIKNGHKDIIFVTASHFCAQDTTMRMRWISFSNTAERNGATAYRFVANQTLEQSISNDVKEDIALHKAISQEINNHPKLTGMFVNFDSLTAKLYPILNKIGIKPGTDIEILSCNNEQSYLAGLDPKPVSINLQPEKIGRRAVEQLKWRVMHKNDQEDVQVTIEVKPRLDCIE